MQADFHVATDGNDRNSGSMEQPFATIGQAQAAVRERIKAGLKSDVTVLVHGGTYFLKAPLVFGPEDSGTDKFSITYAAARGEKPIISGGRRITGWKKGKDGLWTVDLSEVKAGKWYFRQLFVNDRRARRARGPNQGFFRVVKAGADNRTSFQFKPGNLRSYGNLRDAEVVFLHDWCVSRMRIAAIDEKTNTVRFTDPIGHRISRITRFEPHPRYYVENALELLDSPGEWYLDRKAGTLVYRPLPDEDIKQAKVIAPVLDRLLVVKGDADKGEHVSNLGFVGLTFSHARTPHLDHGYAGVQAGFHESRPVKGKQLRWPRTFAAISFEVASNCRVENCCISHLGRSGISFRRQCVNNQLVGCEIFDISGNGVLIGEGKGFAVHDLRDRPTREGGCWWLEHPEYLDRGNVVSNNYIHHCGVFYHGCIGVWVGITEGTVVSHNEVCNLPYSGVSVGWMWNTAATPCKANVIEYNHIHHVMEMLSDGGGIFTQGRQPGTVLRGNLIHDISPNAGVSGSNGMFLDQGSSEILIEQNTIYGIARAPIRFHRATGNTIRKNVLVTPNGRKPFAFHKTDMKSMTYEGNAVIKSESWTPPKPGKTKAGLEPVYRKRLLSSGDAR